MKQDCVEETKNFINFKQLKHVVLCLVRKSNNQLEDGKSCTDKTVTLNVVTTLLLIDLKMIKMIEVWQTHRLSSNVLKISENNGIIKELIFTIWTKSCKQFSKIFYSKKESLFQCKLIPSREINKKTNAHLGCI